jgi:hypothetical protein
MRTLTRVNESQFVVSTISTTMIRSLNTELDAPLNRVRLISSQFPQHAFSLVF